MVALRILPYDRARSDLSLLLPRLGRRRLELPLVRAAGRSRGICGGNVACQIHGRRRKGLLDLGPADRCRVAENRGDDLSAKEPLLYLPPAGPGRARRTEPHGRLLVARRKIPGHPGRHFPRIPRKGDAEIRERKCAFGRRAARCGFVRRFEAWLEPSEPEADRPCARCFIQTRIITS